MAPPFVACRICYKVEGKVKNYTEDEFYKQAYEDLSGYPFDDIQYITKFCASCATLLRKYYRLRKHCRSNYRFIIEHLDTGRKMTHRFVNDSAELMAKLLPSSLKNWTMHHTTVIDCTHTPKRYKPKQKNEDFYVKHLAVPKDDTELPIPKEIKKKTGYDLDHELWFGYSCDDDDSLDVDDEMPPETSVSVSVDPMMCVEPVLSMDPVIETVMSLNPVMSMEPVMNMDPVMSVDPVILVEVKVEDVDNVGDLLDIAEEKETQVKSERDPDSLTLQEIKDELQTARGSFEDAENIKNEEIVKEKGKKGNKKKEKLPKPTKRQIIQAKRLQSNQDLQDHFSITSFLTDEEQMKEFLLRTTGEGYREGRFKCELCLKSFKEQKWIDAHTKKHEVSLAQALKHHGWHEGVEHTCQHCGVTFKKHTTYMGHLRRAHPSSYICGFCAGSFVSAYGLNLHIKAVHKNDKIEKDGTRCEECDVTFVSQKMYIKHILITDKHKELSKNILGCRKCGEQFDSRELLEKHTHYKERKYVKRDVPQRSIKCDECDEVFSHPNGVYQHYLREHPDKPYQFAIQRHYLCEQCGKTFKSPGLLQQHGLIHKGLRPPTAKKQPGRNSCRQCGKTYSKLSGLFRHKQTHLGVRRHKCHICEKAFTDTSNLKQHVQGVHLNIRRTRKK